MADDTAVATHTQKMAFWLHGAWLGWGGLWCRVKKVSGVFRVFVSSLGVFGFFGCLWVFFLFSLVFGSLAFFWMLFIFLLASATCWVPWLLASKPFQRTEGSCCFDPKSSWFPTTIGTIWPKWPQENSKKSPPPNSPCSNALATIATATNYRKTKQKKSKHEQKQE